MNECDVIRQIAAKFTRSAQQLNGPFECDAELVRIGDATWGLTLDDFSPGEDRFTSDDPVLLGSNLAVATLSDLLAAGVQPTFFLHAMSLPPAAPPAFFEGLAEGVKAVLDAAGCAFCGGDLGTADTWRYCGFAMGPVASAQPLTHRMPRESQALWVTGRLGDANLAALLNRATPRFELRLDEASAIRRHATACIDTSGGLMDAIWILHDLNPGLRFEIHAESIPMAHGLREAARSAGIPAEAALLGGAGEYELLFAVRGDPDDARDRTLRAMGMSPIAEIRAEGAPGIHLLRNHEPIGVMTGPPPCPRAAATVADHVKAVVNAASVLFGHGC